MKLDLTRALLLFSLVFLANFAFVGGEGLGAGSAMPFRRLTGVGGRKLPGPGGNGGDRNGNGNGGGEETGSAPTGAPSAVPVSQPKVTSGPTPSPTASPTTAEEENTAAPTSAATAEPTEHTEPEDDTNQGNDDEDDDDDAVHTSPEDTPAPTGAPEDTAAPTEAAPEDTAAPTEAPDDTAAPTEAPEDTAAPTEVPEDTAAPTEVPVDTPAPTEADTSSPSAATAVDTNSPTEAPTTDSEGGQNIVTNDDGSGVGSVDDDNDDDRNPRSCGGYFDCTTCLTSNIGVANSEIGSCEWYSEDKSCLLTTKANLYVDDDATISLIVSRCGSDGTDGGVLGGYFLLSFVVGLLIYKGRSRGNIMRRGPGGAGYEMVGTSGRSGTAGGFYDNNDGREDDWGWDDGGSGNSSGGSGSGSGSGGFGSVGDDLEMQSRNDDEANLQRALELSLHDTGSKPTSDTSSTKAKTKAKVKGMSLSKPTNTRKTIGASRRSNPPARNAPSKVTKPSPKAAGGADDIFAEFGITANPKATSSGERKRKEKESPAVSSADDGDGWDDDDVDIGGGEGGGWGDGWGDDDDDLLDLS